MKQDNIAITKGIKHPPVFKKWAAKSHKLDDCPRCEGKGKHLILGTTSSMERCSACNGTGKVLKHRLDRPDREKLIKLLHTAPAKREKVGGNTVVTVDLERLADLILALFDEEEIREQIEVLKLEIAHLNKKLDDRESDLIEAKREERERILADIKMHTVSTRADKKAEGWLKIHLTYHKDYWQALKRENNG